MKLYLILLIGMLVTAPFLIRGDTMETKTYIIETPLLSIDSSPQPPPESQTGDKTTLEKTDSFIDAGNTKIGVSLKDDKSVYDAEEVSWKWTEKVTGTRNIFDCSKQDDSLIPQDGKEIGTTGDSFVLGVDDIITERAIGDKRKDDLVSFGFKCNLVDVVQDVLRIGTATKNPIQIIHEIEIDGYNGVRKITTKIKNIGKKTIKTPEVIYDFDKKAKFKKDIAMFPDGTIFDYNDALIEFEKSDIESISNKDVVGLVSKTDLKPNEELIIDPVISTLTFNRNCDGRSSEQCPDGGHLGVHYYNSTQDGWVARGGASGDLFNDSFVAGDKIGFAMQYGLAITGVYIKLNQSVKADDITCHWEYRDTVNGGVYRNLTPYFDNSSCFTVNGTVAILWTMKDIVGMGRHTSTSSGTGVQLVIDSVTNPTDGGYFVSQVHGADGKFNWASGNLDATDLYDTSEYNNWSAISNSGINVNMDRTWQFYGGMWGDEFTTKNEMLSFLHPTSYYNLLANVNKVYSGELNADNIGIRGSSWACDKTGGSVSAGTCQMRSKYIYIYDSYFSSPEDASVWNLDSDFMSIDYGYRLLQVADLYHSKLYNFGGTGFLDTGVVTIVDTQFHDFGFNRANYWGMSGVSVLTTQILAWTSHYSCMFDSTVNSNLNLNGGTQNFHFIDCDLTNANFGTGNANSNYDISYSTLIKVQDSNGNVLKNVNLSVYNKSSELVLNAVSDEFGFMGESNGTVTSSADRSLDDSTKSWVEHQFNPAIVYITDGTGKGQKRGVNDNDANTLEIAKPWSTNPDTTSKYVVISTIMTQKYPFANSVSAVDYAPFNITFSKTGYADYKIVNYNITNKINWVVTLTDKPEWDYSQAPIDRVRNKSGYTVFKISKSGDVAIAGQLYEYTNSPPSYIKNWNNLAWLTIRGDLYLNGSMREEGLT